MSDSESYVPTVVVGIDGSRWAVDAALWATDEAVRRDIPLRLVYAIESSSTDPKRCAHELANAESAIRYAFTAVESTDKALKIEVEIVQRGPTRALLDASRSAAMLCVGSAGLHHRTRGRMGSTAMALAGSAHCPLAIVHRRADARVSRPGAIAAVFERSTTSDWVLERGLEEALLRDAPLQVVALRSPGSLDRNDDGRRAEVDCWAQAALNRRVARWQRRYPDLDIVTQTWHGSLMDYLSQRAGSVQLIVVDHGRSDAAGALLGPAGRARLDEARCTVLVCDPQSRL